MAAVLSLLTILAGIFAEVLVSERLIVPSDAAQTATNILTHKSLFQFSFTVYLVEMACQIGSVVFFYLLLRPVSRSVALLSASLELTGCVIKTFARVFYISPLFVLERAPVFSGFSTEQLQSVVLILLRVNVQGAAVALAFFGFSTVLQGYLIFRSTFLPRWLGVLAMISGVGWLAFLYPPLGSRAFLIVALFALLSAIAMIGWLLVFGVNEERWKARAGAAALSSIGQ